MIRVLIAASSAVMRAGLYSLITLDPELEVAGQISSNALMHELDITHPDIILLDIDWQSGDRIPRLVSTNPSLPMPAMIVLSDDISGSWIADALKMGAMGVLPRDATRDEIIGAIHSASLGLITLHTNAVSNLIPFISVPAPARQVLDRVIPSLTGREIEVLRMLAEGLGNKAIARKLSISEHTVKFHISSIFTKLNVSSRTEAVTIGARQGLIVL
jgi:NarL family two-component system response regulator YdfI